MVLQEWSWMASCLLVLSHVATSILSISLALRYSDYSHSNQPSPAISVCPTTIAPPPLVRVSEPGVCSASAFYPVPLPATLRSFCNAASPHSLLYQTPRYTKQDIAISLLTVDAYKYSRDEACLHSWLTRTRVPYGYLGVTIPRSPLLLQPTLVIPDSADGYISNLNKTLISLVLLYRAHPDMSWFMQSSDDAYLDVDALLLKLSQYNSSDVIYAGGSTWEAYCWLTGRQMTFFEGGTGIVLSNGLMRRYAEQMEAWINGVWMTEQGRSHKEVSYGDVMVGCFMDEHSIPLTKLYGGHNRIPAGKPSSDNDFPVQDNRWYGWHYVGSDQMIDVDLFFQLQRVDQLEAHLQWRDLLQFTREMLVEKHEQAKRGVQLLTNILQNKDAFNNSSEVEEAPK